MSADYRNFAQTGMRLTRVRRAAHLAAVTVLVLAAAPCVSSCAANGWDDGQSAWRGGTVRAVVTMRELDAAIPMCSLRATVDARASDVRVAIVRSRVGKAAYDEAFVLGAGLNVGTGSHVRFYRKDCVVQLAADSGSS